MLHPYGVRRQVLSSHRIVLPTKRSDHVKCNGKAVRHFERLDPGWVAQSSSARINIIIMMITIIILIITINVIIIRILVLV